MTATTSMLHIRVDDDIKARASQVLAAVGMTLSEAVRLFLHRVVAEQAYPLELKVPNAATRAAMLEADELIQARNKSVNAAADPTGIDWMLQQPLQTGGEAGMSNVSILQERIKGD
jgi:DNA-damage-inducible protein J